MTFATEAWKFDERAQTGDDDGRQEWELRTDAKIAEKAELREKISHRLIAEGEIKLAAKLESCGLPVPMVCVSCGTGKICQTHCKRRWCPSCAWLVQRRRLDRYAGAVKLMKSPSFLTLTIENSPDPEIIRKLRGDWSKMRRRKLMAGKIAGGVAAIEITSSETGWHPHIHAIIDCPWLAIATPEPHWSDTPEERDMKCKHAQFELSHLWATVAKQRHGVVWINRLKSMSAVIYTLQYSIQASDLLDSLLPIGPLIEVIEKSRLVSAFGNLHGRTAEMDDDEKPTVACPCCGEEKSIVPTSVVYSIARKDPAETLPTVPFKAGYPKYDRS